MAHDKALEDMAARGRWLIEKLSERLLPDGRCVLEISEEPIWIAPDGTLRDYIKAVDLAMERDASRYTPQWDVPRARFAVTYCSQCGGSFGPGDAGFSHCEDHKAAA
jgi:hypothetical protein